MHVHDGGVAGIAKDVHLKLSEAFLQYFNRELYDEHSMKEVGNNLTSERILNIPKSVKPDAGNSETVTQLSLFSDQVIDDLSVKKAKKSRKSTGQSKITNFQQLSFFDADEVNTSHNKPRRASRSDQKESVQKKPLATNLTKPKEVASLFHELPDNAVLKNEVRAFDGEVKAFYREDTIIISGSSVGKLKINRRDGSYIFHPLELSKKDQERIQSYINLRDSYHSLYEIEARSRAEDKEGRQLLNRTYDEFTGRYGNLNIAENIRFIKMDSSGNEVPFLERVVGGVIHKADIFTHPVSFSTAEVAVSSASEALSASLNQTGSVDLAFMIQVSGLSEKELRKDLQGQIFFNPLSGELEVSQKFLAGNVVLKATQLNDYLANHPEDMEARQSLEALEKVIPEPIKFEELDFNLGERWIDTEIYNRFASHLFDTDVRIYYSESSDDFSVNAESSNIRI